MAVAPSGRDIQRGSDSRYDYLLAEAIRQKYVGDVNEAATLFEKCIELDRSRAVPYFELAQMYSSAGIGGKAMMYASRAARLEPDNYWYQMASGSLFTQYEMKDSAMVYFARALKADPAALEVNGILAGFYAKHMKVRTILFIAMFSALAGSVLLLLNINNAISVAGVGLIGFAIAPIFPAMVSDTSRRVGDKYAANTIGIQLAGAGLGGAVISSAIGILAERFSLEAVPWAMVINFSILILLFVLSLTGSKSNSPVPGK